jgi:hypothetical protein
MKKLRRLSKETGIPMGRMIDRAIMAMYEDEFKKL